jgi:hypothetical protein
MAEILSSLTSCGTPRDKVDNSRSPLEARRVVEPGSTCGSHGHSRHKRATDPDGTNSDSLSTCVSYHTQK